MSTPIPVPAAKSQIREGRNIVKPMWIIESIKHGRMLPFLEEYEAEMTCRPRPS